MIITNNQNTTIIGSHESVVGSALVVILFTTGNDANVYKLQSNCIINTTNILIMQTYSIIF